MVFRIVIEDLFSWFDYGLGHLNFIKNLVLFLIHNHHFKWWFVLALIRAILLLAQKGGIASFVTGPL